MPRSPFSVSGTLLDADREELVATHRYPKLLSCVKHFPGGSRQGRSAWVFFLSLRGSMLSLGCGLPSLTSGRRSRVDKNIADSSELFFFAVGTAAC